MPGPDPHDDTSADYEQFEKVPLAQDRDAAGVDTADIDEATTRGLVDDALAALTRFRVELGHLEDPLQLCERCSPGGRATYWTRDLEAHLVEQ